MLKDNSPRVEQYIKNEDARNILRGLVLKIEKNIPAHIFKDLIKLINEDEITEVYLDCMLREYGAEDTVDDVDSIDYAHDPFEHGHSID